MRNNLWEMSWSCGASRIITSSRCKISSNCLGAISLFHMKFRIQIVRERIKVIDCKQYYLSKWWQTVLTSCNRFDHPLTYITFLFSSLVEVSVGGNRLLIWSGKGEAKNYQMEWDNIWNYKLDREDQNS